MREGSAALHAMKLLLLPVFVFTLGTGTAWTQSGRAMVSGLIVDESGAVIVGVEVTATNIDTNDVTSTRSTDAGLYSLVNLPVGPIPHQLIPSRFHGAVQPRRPRG